MSSPSLGQVKQLSLWAALSSLGYVFWVIGAMEMVERLAYFGVKTVAALYATDPVSAGGLGVDMGEFGTLLMVWALLQTFVPALTGGLSDRYGYKQTIFVSTLIKIAGYLTMAFWGSYWGFFAGAILLAVGTGVFKPGIQGSLVRATAAENSSMAWGVFYQVINIGGFLGPLVAGLMRKMAWENVFFSCAAIVSLNLVLIFAYREPKAMGDAKAPKEALIGASLRELRKPVLWVYLLIFSGFWFMFSALFDVLPVHIDEWVYTEDIVASLLGEGQSAGQILSFFVILSEDGKRIQPEGLLNVNAGLIMVACFVFAYMSGRMRATTSMVTGTLLASGALFLIGQTQAGWWMVGAISVFSVGEMLASPKFSEFIGNIAPADKKAMYLGFSQLPPAIGWTLEGKLGPWLYGEFASKEAFSREMLLKNELLSEGQIDAIPQGEAFSTLVELSGQSARSLTSELYQLHDVSLVWDVLASVGLLTAVALYFYGRWLLRLGRTVNED